jgi:hypothetical protein
VVIERTSTEVIVRLSNKIAWEEIQLMLNFFQYREKIAKSQATQEEIDELATEINKNWWSENQQRFLK